MLSSIWLLALLVVRALGEFNYYDPRPPGTLLLNMLIKNEAEHLERTLPRWAKIIDYWIIGVDDANTDESPEIIKKYLGHIPGEIVIVNFDGMGPTWTQLVKHGLKHYPNATHGIIADADFMPMQDTLDKYQLDIRCSKHMYTIYTEDHQHNRKMDWIYRNIEGAEVKRRVHQTLEVPALPNQEVFQTLIDLNIEEREGGYQDRSGNKMRRYIDWLKKDLLEYPDDPRTLYYLGYSHFDIFLNNKDDPKQEHWDALAKSVEYYSYRANLPKDAGNQEERWFTLLKLGEIYERFYKDWPKAKEYYLQCADADPERADAWFYAGQGHRLRGEAEESLQYLEKAATVPIPERSLFHWLFLYRCLAKLEYARAVNMLANPDLKTLRNTRYILSQADCFEGTASEKAELDTLKAIISNKIDEVKGGNAPKTRVIERLIKFLDHYKTKVLDKKLPKRLLHAMEAQRPHFNDAIVKGADISCGDYRRATTPYLRLFRENQASIESDLKDNSVVLEKWQKIVGKMRRTCR
jgi:tetratricopeptide (TPR) repeat protein